MQKVEFTSYALIGSGKLARHLEFYLKSLNLPVQTWSRRSSSIALHEAVAGASHLLFAVSDGALAKLTSDCDDSGRVLVHFSGALHLKSAHAAHPLMTFGPDLHPLSWYQSIPFVCDKGFKLSDLLPGLKNPAFSLSPERRALYHSLCSLAGNSTFLLWRRIGERFETELGLPREILAPFLRQTVDTALSFTESAFTGPVARGDWGTVENHLNALSQHPELLSTYKNYLHLAESSGVQLPEVFK